MGGSGQVLERAGELQRSLPGPRLGEDEAAVVDGLEVALVDQAVEVLHPDLGVDPEEALQQHGVGLVALLTEAELLPASQYMTWRISLRQNTAWRASDFGGFICSTVASRGLPAVSTPMISPIGGPWAAGSGPPRLLTIHLTAGPDRCSVHLPRPNEGVLPDGNQQASFDSAQHAGEPAGHGQVQGAGSGPGGPVFTQGGVMPGGSQMEDWRENPLDPMAPIGIRSRAVEPDTSMLRLGPLEKIYLIWMVGGSCDGCTVAVAGATHPRVEHLLAGIIPGLPRVELIHTVVSTEVGPEWTHNLFMAERGELDAPYVI